MGAVFREMDNYRLQNMYVYAQWIGKRGPLPGGERRAGELMWSLASPDVGRCAMNSVGPKLNTPTGSPTR